jgi:hypothetical protein
MPSGLAEQSPIYKHKVSDTLCPSATRLNSQRERLNRDENGFPGLFPTRGNLALLDVDPNGEKIWLIGHGVDQSCRGTG